MSGLFLLLTSCQGVPKRSKRAGLGLPAPGSPWSLRAGVKKGSGKRDEEPGGSSGDRLNWPPLPGFRCHVTESQVSQVRDWRAPSYPPPDSWAELWWGFGGRLGGSSLSWSYTACPHTPPTVLLQVPHTPGVPRKGSGRGSTGLGAVRPGHAPSKLHRRPRRSLGPPGRGPSAHTRRRLRRQRRRWGSCAPSASREHKQGEEAGVSAWARCQRAGAGTQCPERAGERGTRTA